MHHSSAVSVPLLGSGFTSKFARGWLRALLVTSITVCFLVPSLLPAAADAKRRRKRKRKQRRRPPVSKPAPAPKPAPTPTAPTKAGSPGTVGDAPTRPAKRSRGKRNKNPKKFDFTGLNIGGRLRTPQLLYFLDRASQELKRASLERRSFIPEMVRSVDEESL